MASATDVATQMVSLAARVDEIITNMQTQDNNLRAMVETHIKALQQNADAHTSEIRTVQTAADTVNTRVSGESARIDGRIDGIETAVNAMNVGLTTVQTTIAGYDLVTIQRMLESIQTTGAQNVTNTFF
jgi:hypothetical protein